ncbi:hypothetical protein TGAM01_v202210 [Trichoderma gamsii]|uniref:Uncharacterized protein n=1 Tax=Trichoderma gamsii TaxID=398673 RepID=A0A2P4ZXT1_9HYPO|nr:hypothetical protein TGAM01_v202210 [Trichoderma gamsii]PON29102.1 hypothetical protein TGAM01_v202210 [Trichoderma gamsii]
MHMSIDHGPSTRKEEILSCWRFFVFAPGTEKPSESPASPLSPNPMESIPKKSAVPFFFFFCAGTSQERQGTRGG